MARKHSKPAAPESLYSLTSLARRFRRSRTLITRLVDRLGLETQQVGPSRVVFGRDLPRIRAELPKCKPAEWGGVGVKKKRAKDANAPDADSAAPRSSPGDPLARSA